MSKINCCVDNCSHHKNGICYANLVTVSGASANHDSETCCSSFLNQDTYSKLTSNTESSGSCDSLICRVSTCTHNSNCTCLLDSIEVSGEKPILYCETCCASYKKS